jgi:hypothetical protein
MQSWAQIAVLCILVLYLLGLLFRMLGLWSGTCDLQAQPTRVSFPDRSGLVERFTGPDTTSEGEPVGGETTSLLKALQFSEVRDAARKAGPVATGRTAPPTIDERFKSAKKPLPEERLTKGVLTQKERMDRLNTMIRRPQTSAKRRQWRDEFRDYFRGDPVPVHRNEPSVARSRNDGEALPGALTCNKESASRWQSSSTPVGGLNEPDDGWMET